MNINAPNIKIYLVLSGILVVVFVALLLIPLNRNQQQNANNHTVPTPTTIEANSFSNPTVVLTPTQAPPAAFTGAKVEPLPTGIVDQVSQKQELRGKVPLSLTTFYIDFDYSQDKFVVSLNDPKAQSLQEFQSWKSQNYPAVTMDQFIFK